MEVLSSRILLRPADLVRSRRFYRDVLGLAIYREFGPPDDPGVVFFLGPGLLEVSGHSDGAAGHTAMIWLQVRDVNAEHERLAAAGARILREPLTEPWGLTEMWIEDPDGVQIVLVEVPADHPLRRDLRSLPATAMPAPGKYGWADDVRAATVQETVTPREEVRPMNAVHTWVLPSSSWSGD